MRESTKDERSESVPGRPDYGEVCRRLDLADANFEVFFALIRKVEARSGVVPEAKEVAGIICKIYGLDFGGTREENRKVGGTPGINDRDALRVRVGQQVLGDGPAVYPDRVGAVFFRFIPNVKNNHAEDKHEKDSRVPFLHGATTVHRMRAVASDFRAGEKRKQNEQRAYLTRQRWRYQSIMLCAVELLW
jgi:hypothetical protein